MQRFVINSGDDFYNAITDNSGYAQVYFSQLSGENVNLIINKAGFVAKKPKYTSILKRIHRNK
jgi:hypothetical protein